ncbi:hypothetical protein LINPERHAP1_LOCUS35682 [Linum perenne]
MVYIGGRGEESVRRRDGAAMAATRTERSKPPLHNFNLPCLKWGNQKQLRCLKISDSSHRSSRNNNNNNNPRNGGISFSASDRHHRTSRPPPSKFAAASRNCDARPHHHHNQFKKPNPVVGGGADEGIDAVRKKLMLDLKTAADRMKQEFLREKEACVEDEDEDELGHREKRRRSSPPASVTGDVDKLQEPRPWNLRTRRAACKAPAAASIETTPAAGKGLKIEDRKESSCSPIRSKREKEEEEEEKPENRMAKLSVSLSRKEIETDFMAMLGRRPARRPRKRPRIVQKQIDALSVGFWLREVNLDTYKVEEEIADTGKISWKCLSGGSIPLSS